jgi:hypothetical protein
VTDLLDQDVPLEDVQHLAGHADPLTTTMWDLQIGREKPSGALWTCPWGSDVAALVARSPLCHWFLIGAYLLALALGQCAHDHGVRPGVPSILVQESSADHGLCLTSPSASDSPRHVYECPACQFLSQHQAAGPADVLSDRHSSVGVADDTAEPSILEGPPHRPACRAPPLA